MTLGQHLTHLRTGRGWSQDVLAEQLGVSRQSVSKWETDSGVPDLDKLLGLSELFGVTLDELVKGPAEDGRADTESEDVSSDTGGFPREPSGNGDTPDGPASPAAEFLDPICRACVYGAGPVRPSEKLRSGFCSCSGVPGAKSG